MMKLMKHAMDQDLRAGVVIEHHSSVLVRRSAQVMPAAAADLHFATDRTEMEPGCGDAAAASGRED